MSGTAMAMWFSLPSFHSDPGTPWWRGAVVECALMSVTWEHLERPATGWTDWNIVRLVVPKTQAFTVFSYFSFKIGKKLILRITYKVYSAPACSSSSVILYDVDRENRTHSSNGNILHVHYFTHIFPKFICTFGNFKISTGVKNKGLWVWPMFGCLARLTYIYTLVDKRLEWDHTESN